MQPCTQWNVLSPVCTTFAIETLPVQIPDGGFRADYRKPGCNSQRTSRGILSNSNIFENCILLVFWYVGMDMFQQTRIQLHNTDMNLNEAVNILLRSLNNYVASLRDAIEDLMRKGGLNLALNMSRCKQKID